MNAENPHFETSGLAHALAAGETVVTAEVTPPLTADAEDLLEKARPLKGLVDAVNVTDGAGARAHLSSAAAAALLVQEGIEPVLQCTCRDRNRIALQSDLLGAAAFGVRNLLMLTGDDPKLGDQPDAKPVFDLSTTGFIEMARTMSEDGRLPSGREIVHPPRLFLGTADAPFDPAPDWRPDKLAERADAGAHFVQTQFCFDIGVLERYYARLRDAGLTERMAMILGIGPIASARSGRWMRENLYGVIIPDELIERLEKAKDEKAEGRKICVELIQQIIEIDGVAGVHVMAIRQEDAIPDILAAAGVGPAHRKA